MMIVIRVGVLFIKYTKISIVFLIASRYYNTQVKNNITMLKKTLKTYAYT